MVRFMRFVRDYLERRRLRRMLTALATATQR
jgi:hypothetical protein